jgi:hypothetical protein
MIDAAPLASELQDDTTHALHRGTVPFPFLFQADSFRPQYLHQLVVFLTHTDPLP